MSGLVVRPGPSQRGLATFTVEAGGDIVARAVITRSRPVLDASAPGHLGVPPSTVETADPDPQAWPASIATRAAGLRWRDPHPAIRTVAALTMFDHGHPPAAVLEAVGAHLAAHGVRRLDVRIPAADPLGGALVGPTWVRGTIDTDVLASLALAFPWTGAPDPQGRLSSLLAPLPPRLRRLGRRVAAVRPRQVPELIRSTTTEAGAAIRHRYAPVTASHPVDGAPDGSHPFAASRYRTVRAAFALVSDPLRAAPFLDVGCGDGRVLREALDAGFPRVIGRELDPALVQRARTAVGDGGEVEAGDALAVPVPDDVGVVFLNNPFDGAVLARFSELLAATLDRRPRALLVLYLNPRPIEPLLAAGLVLVHVEPRFSILASRVRP